MKNILLFVFICLSTFSSGQKHRNVRQEIGGLRNILLQHHVEPREVNDDFSADLFDKFINELDPDRIFFTAIEINLLNEYRFKVDDEINRNSIDFLNHLKTKYRSGLERSERIISSTLSASLDWQSKELYDPEPPWAEDENKLNEHIRRWLKYQVLDRMSELMQRDTDTAGDFFARNVDEAVRYVQISALRPLTRLIKNPVLYDNEVSNAFLQSVAGVFDPHSTFFSAEKYDNFVASLSTQDYSFGFMLDQDERGNVVISALSPGGAAWNSGALHVSDVVTSVRWGTEAATDLRGMHTDDINELFATSSSDQLELTINGADGVEKKITLRKQKQESDQNVVQSFILKGEIKAGYIYLPDFYTRWDDESQGGQCANDVAKEIFRLKNAGIEGIILDLRFNGGGSLSEAQAMGGIFIDEGPLAMVSHREKKIITLKDMNRGTVYDGPLILMVNSLSASASEVLAACIQDYNRGLIVGSSTYGKATGQSLIPINKPGAPAGFGRSATSDVSYAKVTTQKIFRVTGKSSQGLGVAPDICLPDIHSLLNPAERQHPFVLRRDSIPANRYYKPLKPIKRDELQRLSRERIAKSIGFQDLLQDLRRIESEIDRQSQPSPLSWKEYVALGSLEHERRADSDHLNELDKIYEVANTQTKDDRLTLDDYARTLNERWQEILTSDINLQETYHILQDYISLTKNP